MMGGNWNDRIANIVDEQTGEAVARIVRKRLNVRHSFFGQDTYVVTVAPGADMALIAGLCICFDEKNNDQREIWGVNQRTKCNIWVGETNHHFVNF